MALFQLSAALGRAQRHSGFTRLGALAFRGYSSVDQDTHDDFKPKYKGAKNDVNSQIEKDIKGHDVFLYMKGTPLQPQCGFSNRVVQILNAYGVRYGSRNVLEDPAIREGVKVFSDWPTIPQVYVKGEFVGGADILYNMHEEGELETLLGPIIEEQEKKAKESGTKTDSCKCC